MTNKLSRSNFKKLGLVFFHLFLNSIAHAAQEIELHVRKIKDSIAQQNRSLKVEQNETFMLTATVKGNCNKSLQDTPIIRGLENFNTSTASQGGGSIEQNNTITPTYNYHYYLTPNLSGNFKIGPATCTIDDEIYESNSVQINVTTTEQLKDFFATAEILKNTATQDRNNDAFKLFVGQKATLLVKVYINSSQMDSIDNFEIKKPELQNIEIADMPTGGITSYNENRGRKNFKVIECQYSLVPLRSGIFEILPLTINYNISKRPQNYGWVSYFYFPSVPVSLHTNNGIPLGIEVLPIPDKAQAIGSDFELKLCLEKQNFMPGEPINLILDISGTGDFDKIVHPTLNLPKKIRAYESASGYLPLPHQQKNTQFKQCKRFEYTLQTSKTGTHTILPQEFSYFDTNQEKIIIKKSNSTSFFIMPDANSADKTTTKKLNDEKEEENLSAESTIKAHKNISEQLAVIGLIECFDSKVPKSSRNINWLIIFLSLLLIAGWFFWQEIIVWLELKARKKTAYLLANRAIDKAIKKTYLNAVYYIFLEYFVKRFGIVKETLDFEWIEQTLIKIFNSKIKATEFIEFFSEAAALAFGKNLNKYGKLESDLFFCKAKTWLSCIENHQKLNERGRKNV